MNDSKGKPRHSQAASTRGSMQSFRSSKRNVGGPRQSRAGKSSRGSVAASRATTRVGADRDRIVILDEHGKDVTPKPMMSTKPTVLKGVHMSGMEPGSPYSEMTADGTMNDRSSSQTFSQSNYFSESTDSSPKSEAYEASERIEGDASEGARTDGEDEKGRDSKPRHLSLAEMFDIPEKPLRPEDLEKEVFVTLTETETFWMFEASSVTVSVESADAENVEARNARYKNILKDHETSDRYIEGEMQTLNLMQKQKEVQCDPLVVQAKDTQANVWSIYDAFAEDELAGEDQDDAAVVAATALNSTQLAAMSGHATRVEGARSMAGTINGSAGGSQMYADSDMPSMMTGGSTQYGTTISADGQPIAAAVEWQVEVQDPLASVPKAELIETLQLVDAVLAQNIFLDKLLLYRNVKPLEVQESAMIRKAEQQAAAVAADAARKEAQAKEAAAKAAAAAAIGDEEEGREDEVLDGATGEPLKAEDVGGGSGGEKQEGAEEAASKEEEEEEEEEVDPSATRMQLLWEFKCDITNGRNVSCLGWNKVRKDLLAVAYGQFDFGKQNDGLVAFWSLKNPNYPLWHFTTHCGVTALDFSTKNGNILAVGMYDGTVAIYDVMTRQQTAAMEATHSSGKHSDPVWKMRWVEQGPDMDKLVTISTDGRVSMWSITKGLEFSDLMKLKRVAPKEPPNAPQGGAAANMNTEAFISRRSSGMSFDFSTRDPRIYIAGTEDGPIHKCSTSYSEQYLETYMGHKGPVYNVQWSPFRPGLFVSCSSDWTVRLWTEEKEHELLIFQSASEQVNDVQWCPTNSTVFGTVTNGGYAEIWDISVSTMKPVAAKRPAGSAKQNCLLFSDTSPVVVCGGASGSVSVYRLFNCTREDETRDEQRKRLDDAITANIVKTAPGE